MHLKVDKSWYLKECPNAQFVVALFLCANLLGRHDTDVLVIYSASITESVLMTTLLCI